MSPSLMVHEPRGSFMIQPAFLNPTNLLTGASRNRGNRAWSQSVSCSAPSKGADERPSSGVTTRVARGLLVAALMYSTLIPTPSLFAREYVDGASGVQIIHNQLLHYGNYCGPGPSQVCTEKGCSPVPGLPAIDQIDQSCQLHDMTYCKCKKDAEKRGHKPFPGMHLVMAVRGALPPPLADALVKMDREYSSCMHEADTKLVKDFKAHIDGDLLPRWWDDASLAPKGAENTRGYKQACAVGFRGTCVVNSRFLFTRFTELFTRDLMVDEVAGITGGERESMTTSR